MIGSMALAQNEPNNGSWTSMHIKDSKDSFWRAISASSLMSDGIFAGEPGEENTSKLKIDYIRKNFRDRVGGPGSETGGPIFRTVTKQPGDLHLTEEIYLQLKHQRGSDHPEH